MVAVIRVAIMALVLVGSAGALRAESVDWPPDLAWFKDAKRVEVLRGEQDASRLLTANAELEQRLFQRATMVVVGRVLRLESYVVERSGEARTAITIAVDECVKGGCIGGEITTHVSGAIIGEENHWMRGSGPPELGQRYVFCLRTRVSEPGLLWGGYHEESLVVDEDGTVARKGIGLGAFLDAVRDLTNRRSPPVLLRLCDAAVVGVVVAANYSCILPPDEDPRSETEVSDYVRNAFGHDADPLGHNYMDVLVERVLLGDVAEGEVVHVALPYLRGARGDLPVFMPGTRVLQFLNRDSEGVWVPRGAADSTIAVQVDGGIGVDLSIDELAEAAGME